MTELAPGDILSGDYTIEGVAGHGAMGVVYRAVDERFERLVAVKVTASALADLPNFNERLLREARLAAGIDHPGVVRVHGIGEFDDRPYVVLQWIEGTDLRTRLAAGPLPIDEALSIVEQVGAALDAAHESGCLHRDVKPSNVLVRDTPSGPRAYLTDFGVAKAMQELAGATTLTATGDFVGTPAYLAPELASGADGDPRSDIYGLACIAFEMLSGTAPFSGPTAAAMLVAHCVRPRPLLSERRPGLPPAVDRLLADAMSIDPGERPSSGTAFAQALHAALGGEYGGAELTRAPGSERPAAAGNVAPSVPPAATGNVAPSVPPAATGNVAPSVPPPTPAPAAAAGPAPAATPPPPDKPPPRRPRRGLVIAGACGVALLGGAGAAVVALTGEENRAGAATGGVSTNPRDDPFAQRGVEARAAVVDLFRAYADANRRQSATDFKALGSPQALEYSTPKGKTCGTVVDATVNAGAAVSEQVLAFHTAQWRAGAAPVKLQNLYPTDIESRAMGLLVWEGVYDSARRGSGRMRLVARKESQAATWELFAIDFCPDSKVQY